jgi:hypothetical protein
VSLLCQDDLFSVQACDGGKLAAKVIQSGVLPRFWHTAAGELSPHISSLCS